MADHISFYDTRTREVRAFEPRDGGRVAIYVCGPTVYSRIHIGNARPFVVFSLLKRFLAHAGFEVFLVINVTDVNDKIYAAAGERSSVELAAAMTEAYRSDTDRLALGRPDAEPLASEWIEAIVEEIEALLDAGCAYAAGGDVYFRVRRDSAYGALSRRDVDAMDQGEDNDGADLKEDPLDFALWKAHKAGEDSAWDAPWGRGRPGWHIECSAMAMEYLGESFDLHGGGEDLMFPHHENEIAQSESATHRTFARHWFHVRFLLVEGRKMSKSEGNFYTLRDLLLRGYKTSAIRMLLISVPYRRQLNFTFEGLAAETVAVEKLRTFRDRIANTKWAARPDSDGVASEVAEMAREARTNFRAALADDLNTADARAPIFELVRAVNARADSGKFFAEDVLPILEALREFDRVFAVLEDHDAEWTTFTLDWAEREGKLGQAAPELLATRGVTDEKIQALVEERDQAKRRRDFKRADAIRNELAGMGILLEDSKDGTRWKRK